MKLNLIIKLHLIIKFNVIMKYNVMIKCNNCIAPQHPRHRGLHPRPYAGTQGGG